MSRWSPRTWTLGTQLAVCFTCLTLLALGCSGLLLTKLGIDRQVTTRGEKGLSQARLVASLAAEYRFIQKPDELPLALFTFHQQTGVRPVVVNREGKVIADSWIPSPLMGQELQLPEVKQALSGNEATGNGEVPGEGWLLYAAVPIRYGDRITGAVLISSDMNDLAATLQDSQQQLRWALVITGLLASAAGLALSHYLATPLKRLCRAASAMARGNLATHVTVGGSHEVDELGNRFNEMAAELGRLDEQRRHFVAAASHELRTPIASIRAVADALLADTTGNIDLYKDCLNDVALECDRARLLMNRLLELARLEARAPVTRGDDQANLRTFDLSATCMDLAESLESLAREKNVHLEPAVGESLSVYSDPWLVETVLTNLVQNALKYTPAGGRVTITVSRRGGEIHVDVADTGPGIPAEHLPHLFDRFYRVDSSRARTTGGVGLGLAIAAEAARLLDGRIEVESEVGRGSTFTLVLPEVLKTGDGSQLRSTGGTG